MTGGFSKNKLIPYEHTKLSTALCIHKLVTRRRKNNNLGSIRDEWVAVIIKLLLIPTVYT